ncbi:MAG: hypothetical protein FWE96_00610 [Coriobacteriia bacterium]|nr:hypothetical protein [Coriobacteriia bacterium]
MTSHKIRSLSWEASSDNACVPSKTPTGRNLSFSRKMQYSLILIAISVGLNLIAGFIPARLAAKKDPVVALRTE